MERKPRRLCRLSSSPFFSFCSSRARASITSPARWITSRPCAVIGSTSITPVPRATATSICSVNSRFPLDFERKISYTKSVISRRCGGIGRRPGFKIPCSQERAGSTPATGTTLEKNRTCFFAGSVFILQRRFFLHFIGCDRQKLLHRRPVERIHRLFFRLAPLQRLANEFHPAQLHVFQLAGPHAENGFILRTRNRQIPRQIDIPVADIVDGVTLLPRSQLRWAVIDIASAVF